MDKENVRFYDKIAPFESKRYLQTMTDVFTKQKRSEVMSKIRGRGNKSTELRFRSLLRQWGVKGWRSHVDKLPGRPDFILPEKRIAIFLDGCFWHGCRKCSKGRLPMNNKAFWVAKLQGNQARDRKNNRQLKEMGWKVLRVWEHQLERQPGAVQKRLDKLMLE